MATVTITPGLLSASTNGRAISVTATGSPGTTIHTATSTASTFDQLTFGIPLSNTSTASVVVTVQYGTTATTDALVYSVPAQDTITILGGARINGGLVIRMYAGTTAVINAGAGTPVDTLTVA